MQNIKLILAYQGTRYQGFQRLGSGRELETIQGIVEAALSKHCKQEIKVIGSGRTDAGVHAYGQVVNFHTKKEWDVDQLKIAINQELPKDIQILQATVASSKFHSRYDAVKKIYEYHICTGETANVFERDYALHIREPLNIMEMKKGAGYLCGTHDFAGFSSKMNDDRKTEKTIYDIELIEESEKLILRYTGDGFLYNMVRIMTGTLLEIGMGKRSADSILTVFRQKDRQASGWTVDGKGLFLVKVVYK